ncbi:nucleotide disphospho-sugar-binding domain-containing protein [Spirillospora sp. NPDC052242]
MNPGGPLRVLFTTWAWPSHYFPMVPLAWAFRAAGHQVLIASQPALAETIARSGHPAAVVGSDLDIVGYHRAEHAGLRVTRDAEPPAAWNEAKRARVRQGFAKFAEIADLMADDLLDVARRWRPHLVVHDPLTYAGPLVAGLVGVPAVRSLFGPDFNVDIADLESAAAQPLADRFGVDRIDPLGDLTVDPVPGALQFPAPLRRLHVRYVPYSGQPNLPGWTLDPPDRPRVLVSWGTTTAKFSAEHAARLPEVVAALAGPDAEVVFAVTPDQRALVPDVPDGVRLVESAPLDALLPGCSAVVHQGGAGTTLTVALHGVPQLAVVQTPDQVVNAIPLEKSGAGAFLVPDETTPDALRDGVARLRTDPSAAAAARGLAAEMRGRPSPAAAVRTLERLAHGEPAHGEGEIP